MKTVFMEKISQLRKEKGLSVLDLSNKIGFSKSVIYFWENGQREPNSEALVTLAKFFDVSTDYLLGLENDFGAKIENPVEKKISSEEISPQEIAMLKKIRLLGAVEQAYIKAQIDALFDTTIQKQPDLKNN